MKRLAMLTLTLGLFATFGTQAQAQHFGSDIMVVKMTDPGPAYGFDYAYTDIEMYDLRPQFYTLRFRNPFGTDMDVIVPINSPFITNLPPWSDWPFATSGDHSTRIFIQNFGPSPAVFVVELLDQNGALIDSAMVVCVVP